ncbi:Hypothetical predicted protein, partial [Marmota monax]
SVLLVSLGVVIVQRCSSGYIGDDTLSSFHQECPRCNVESKSCWGPLRYHN